MYLIILKMLISKMIFFKYPKTINKFKEISYCHECSTTTIINKINNL